MQTETAVRFSLVTHGRDSPEGLRDVRGFATKFYTSEGNWDLVGNNIPVRPFYCPSYNTFISVAHHTQAGATNMKSSRSAEPQARERCYRESTSQSIGT